MCEPCRDRYRNYGTTKRAKWKREKEVVVAEMHKLPAEEIVEPAPQPQDPPAPPADPDPWPVYDPGPSNTQADGFESAPASVLAEMGEESNTPTALAPRMCTVSHCREILAGDYQFLRCERHRIQNRHHSKLKRVRDKEVKAQVYDGWAAAINARAISTTSVDENGEGDPEAAADITVTAADMLTFDDIDEELRDGNLDQDVSGVDAPEEELSLPARAEVEETPMGEPSSGLPPAARGTRRTNHVCSIRTCANLLSPSNPWKMCDLCRSRDRAGRRIKAMRDSGLITSEVAEGKIVEVKMEVEVNEKNMKKSKGGKKQKQSKGKGKGKKSAAVDGEVVEGGEGTGSDGQQQAEQTESVTPAMEAVNGSIAPSALHHTPPDEVHQSMFSTVSVPSHPSLVFMEPLLGELATTLQQHLAQAQVR